MQVGVRSALSRDLDARGPQRALPDSLLGCRDLPSIVGRLRNAGVTHLTSLEPLDHSALLPMAVVRPQRIAPATIHVYALRNALGRYGLADGVAKAGPDDALRSMDVEGPGLQPARGAEGQARLIEEHAGRAAFVVQSDRSTTLVLRDSFTPGWRASVDGRPTQVFATVAGHRAVPVPSGTSRVVLDYRPPRIALALGLSVGGILATAGVWYLGPRVWLHRAP
jgi:hypothetical protein